MAAVPRGPPGLGRTTHPARPIARLYRIDPAGIAELGWIGRRSIQ